MRGGEREREREREREGGATDPLGRRGRVPPSGGAPKCREGKEGGPWRPPAASPLADVHCIRQHPASSSLKSTWCLET